MRWPLRRQILLPMVGILLLTIGVVSALNAWLAWTRVQSQLQTQLASVAQTLSASNFPLESGVLRQTRGLTGAEYVVTDEAGLPIAASDEPLSPLAKRWAMSAGRPLLTPSIGVDGKRFFQYVVPLDRRPVGGRRLTLHVFYPEAAWREARWQAAWPPLAIGLVALILVVLVAYVIALRVTHPIQQLRSQVERIAQGDFLPMPAPRRDDELRQLAAAVNQMAQTLARYEEETRKSERLRTLGTLGGGIAHQVRNAATGCRIALDLHQRDCPLTADSGEDPLVVAVRQLELIETYIQRLLALGRPASAVRKPVDLADVLADAVSLVRPMAEHVGVTICCESPPEPLVLNADCTSLVQLLVNLIVNGVQATAQAGVAVLAGGDAPKPTVLVSAEASGPGHVKLLVGDSGPGPSALVRDRLFEPFATDKPGGTGLGLVVARQIAEDHGGTIRWERQDERTWFIVELPRADGGTV